MKLLSVLWHGARFRAVFNEKYDFLLPDVDMSPYLIIFTNRVVTAKTKRSVNHTLISSCPFTQFKVRNYGFMSKMRERSEFF
ncbi:MAG TPA: hypothetical protein VJN71_07200 [Nitrososphaerales archaeon]|nr:hypothetical protein [Nitrososphaerales archaeon]